MRWYKRSLVVAGVLSLFCFSPGALFVGMVLVLPVIVIVGAANAFVYLLAFFPAVLTYQAGRSPMVVAAIAVLSVGAVALGIPAFARVYLDLSTRSYRSDDVGETIDVPGPDVHLNWQSTPKSHQQPPWCGDLCERLLHLEPVRVVYVTSRGETMAYRLKAPSCWLNEKRGSATIGHPLEYCLSIERTDAPVKASLVIEPTVSPVRSPSHYLDLRAAVLSNVYVVEFESARGGGAQLIARRTFVEGSISTYPTHLAPGFGGGVPNKFGIARGRLPSWETQAFDEIAFSIPANPSRADE